MTERVLELLLVLAPESFRRRYARDLMDVHRERMTTLGSRRSAAWFGLREIWGLVLLVLRLRFGGGPATRESGRGRGTSMLETMGQDIRFAGRTLRRSPGFTAAAVAVLALGIGANTAIFTAVNSYFFRPLPFADADRLVMLYETNPEFGWTHAQVAAANALDWRDQAEVFEDIAIYADFVRRVTHVVDGEPHLITAASVTGNFFEVLGVQPALGRGFRWEETWQGSEDKVILSHALWVSMFGSDASVVGSVLDFGGFAAEVVGVMPPDFRFPADEVQLWAPWGWAPEYREAVFFRRAHGARAIGRLAPDVSHEAAEAQLQGVVTRLQQDFPETNRVMGAGFMDLRAFLTRDVRGPLILLVGAVALLLLLACTNVANLMLVRASDRAREVALRYALGAARIRVARLMLTESLMVALAGGVVGLGLGWAGVRAMAALTELGIDGATDIALDARVVLFAFSVAALCGVLFGTAPALRTGARSVGEALKDGGRGGTEGRGGLRTLGMLVTAEVALALLLVAGAGLMLRSFSLLRAVDPGFRTEGVLGIQLTVPSARYPERGQVLAFWDRLAEALEGRAGIERAGLVGRLPLSGAGWSSQFQAEGWPPQRVGFEILHRRADRGYFEALGVPLIRGRLFEPTDGPDDPLVVVINETFAREHFPGEDPIGQKIAYDRAPDASSNWYEIVGIVGDQQQDSPRHPTRAEVFENRDQDWGRTAWIVMRTGIEPMAALPAARAVLTEMDPLIPIASSRALREVWSSSLAREEFMLTLLMAFGVVALLLAAVGVYGVAAQAARRRTQEIGIRMALGAGSGEVLGMMMRQSAGVVGLGLALGTAAALATSGFLSAFLYGVAPNDPVTLVAVIAVLGGVAMVAGYLPARQATAADPVESLRAE